MRRMRKVMHELDRIYFTPLFQRKFKTLTTLKRRRQKMGVKAAPSGKRLRGGGGPATPTPALAVQAASPFVETNNIQKLHTPRQLARNLPSNSDQPAGGQSSDSSDSMDSSQSESLQEPDASSDGRAAAAWLSSYYSRINSV
ncbi:GD13060 [Drosophila simulans]|uniref:GD13060 n=1 Tax=Drosophila simulans TaxID=7240 RepID=B4QKD9_DROSI|nr:GD13060 [Drosophila simulans]